MSPANKILKTPITPSTKKTNASKPKDILTIVSKKDLILDEDGLPVMSDGNILPMDVMTEAVMQVTDRLGK